MNGVQFTTTDNYEDGTVGPQGYPVKILCTWDQPVFVQVARRKHGIERVIYDEIEDVPFPPGDYVFGRAHGLRIKSNGGTPAKVTVVIQYKDDPEILSFSSNT